MKIITFGSMKGGCGKTTLTMLSAAALSQWPFEKKVAAIDLDSQRSLSHTWDLDVTDWESETFYKDESSIPYNVHHYGKEWNKEEKAKHIPTWLKEFKQKGFDYVFFDVAGKLDDNLPFKEQEITTFLMHTDILFLPFVSGNYGTDAAIRYLQYVMKVKKVKKEMGKDLKIIGLINMFTKNRIEDNSLATYLDELASETGIRFMQNKLGNYSAYKCADALTSLYTENAKNNQQKNFQLWIKEVSKILEDE